MREIDELFEKKADEFMKYQKFILEDTQKTIRECFTPDSVEALRCWVRTYGAFYTDNLHIRIFKPTLEKENYVVVDNRFDCTNENYVQLDSFNKTCERYSRPRNIEELILEAKEFKKHTDFYHTVKEEIPKAIKCLHDWEKEYQKKSLDYLNSLDFSIPKDSVEEDEKINDMEM